MSNNQINIAQRKIEKALKKTIHPDNPLAVSMSLRYRELELMKTL